MSPKVLLEGGYYRGDRHYLSTSASLTLVELKYAVSIRNNDQKPVLLKQRARDALRRSIHHIARI